jgi:hypothetical protein
MPTSPRWPAGYRVKILQGIPIWTPIRHHGLVRIPIGDPEKITLDGTRTDSAPPRFFAALSRTATAIGLGRTRDPWSLLGGYGPRKRCVKMGPVSEKGTGLFSGAHSLSHPDWQEPLPGGGDRARDGPSGSREHGDSRLSQASQAQAGDREIEVFRGG